MDLSVVIATRNKASYLEKTLESIVYQKSPFNYEVIVVDDGSTDTTRNVCEKYYTQYIRLEKKIYTNPANAQNVGFKAAKGRVIVTQSDDVVHITPFQQTLEKLYNLLQPKTAVLASVWNADFSAGQWHPREVYCHPVLRNAGLFFLGAVWKEDIYAIGGHDEDFDAPGGHDCWFSQCLMQRCKFINTEEVVGYHQNHPRPNNTNDPRMAELTLYKKALAEDGKIPWISSSGAWKYE